MPHPRIVISGWYGADNAGDDAILQQFLDQMSPAQVTVLTGQPERVEELYGDRGVKALFHPITIGRSALAHWWRGHVRALWRALRAADLFVLGGGGLLRDNVGRRNFWHVVDEIFLARLCKTKSATYALGVGPIVTRFGSRMIRRAMKRCAAITVRDPNSRELLVATGVPEDRVEVVSDPAFLLRPKPVERVVTRGRLIEAIGPRTVSFCPGLGVVKEGRDESALGPIAAALDQLHEQDGHDFLAIPMRWRESGLDDREVARMVQARMRHKHAMRVVDERLSVDESVWLCGQVPAGITVRLHAMIFSVVAGTPVVAINYEPKVRSIFTDLGMESYLVDSVAAVGDQLVERFRKLWRDRSDVITRLDTSLEQVRDRSRATFRTLRGLLDYDDAAA